VVGLKAWRYAGREKTLVEGVRIFLLVPGS